MQYLKVKGENLRDHTRKCYAEATLESQLKSKEFWNCNAFKVTVGTNTPCGGDASHGGITLFRLRNLAGTCWSIVVDGTEVYEPDELTIVLEGDAEAETFVNSLIFAEKTLKKQGVKKHALTMAKRV